jgi:hypothetical protein
MVQVLPYVRSFGEKLSESLSNAAGEVGQAYVERQKRVQANNRDNEIISQLSQPGVSPIDMITLTSKLSPEKRKDVSTLLAPLLKEKTKSTETMSLLEQLFPGMLNQQGAQPGQQAQSPMQSMMAQAGPPEAQAPQPQAQGGINGLPTEQLELLTAIPQLRPFAENALSRRQHEEKQSTAERHHQENIENKKFTDTRDFEYKRAGPILQQADEMRRGFPQLRASLNTIKDSITSGDLGTFSTDWLANVSGLEGFRSGKGALFLTAGKDFFLNNISKVGGRPNQWVEQQLVKMQPEIGRTKEANESVAEFFEFKLDTDEAYVNTLDELSEKYKQELGYVPGDIGAITDKAIKPYVDKREKQLAYKLKVIDERERGPEELKKLQKVPKGTPLTIQKAKALLDYFKDTEDVDERMKKAEEAARKLGYEIVGEEIYGEG